MRGRISDAAARIIERIHLLEASHVRLEISSPSCANVSSDAATDPPAYVSVEFSEDG